MSLGPTLDYVCGEARRAYARDQPRLWVRHLLFVNASAGGPPPYVLVCDEVEAGKMPDRFAGQLMSGFPVSGSGAKLAIQGTRARPQVHLLAPTEDGISSPTSSDGSERRNASRRLVPVRDRLEKTLRSSPKHITVTNGDHSPTGRLPALESSALRTLARFA